MEKQESQAQAATGDEAASREATNDSAGESAVGTTASGSGKADENALPASSN
ncbi:hypothetical protein [Noviherbaspirillum pedocola]|uniref:Uncharacterized protein n=1 Tax=Noviherbaspirillum pedocola TaxID=2801341 RepID=A0A934SYR5_9BURK|nr:hypothetical protein [Noviherbaspirillum pedocola]MBK4735134.1 hypothetical protein [Noviherbaspirillum pedocola]